MKEINVNAKGTATAAVNETNTAAAMGSGSLKVFATPAMVALMEASACNCLNCSYRLNNSAERICCCNVFHCNTVKL